MVLLPVLLSTESLASSRPGPHRPAGWSACVMWGAVHTFAAREAAGAA